MKTLELSVTLNGETRIYAIVGDPIAQVKSPNSVTAAFQKLGLNAILIPYHVAPEDLDQVVGSLVRIQNFDGLVVTVPHKLSAVRFCTRLTERAAFLGAVNVMRRDGSGGWEGEMCDGEGFVNALKAKGTALDGKAAVLLGAGGAGSAIGYSLLAAGVAQLAVYDNRPDRSQDLIGKLARQFGGRVSEWSGDFSGFGVIANATPVGLGSPHESPVRIDALRPDMMIGDVVTASTETALVRAANSLGCVTSSGHEMYAALLDVMVRFLLRRDASAHP